MNVWASALSERPGRLKTVVERILADGGFRPKVAVCVLVQFHRVVQDLDELASPS